jgi:DtxR family Mn-dependent transcriptional regulator
MLSFTEENYLKAILRLNIDQENRDIGTNVLANHLKVKPATVSDMLKKLKEKQLIEYEKYGKIKLTKQGKLKALGIVRKHRLWETFLFEKLEFSWDEVHEVAEQLEHIQSTKLIERLDKYLGFPTVDPHGDFIPNAKGDLPNIVSKSLMQEEVGHKCTIVAVKDNSATFLQYVDKLGLAIHQEIKLISKSDFDDLIEVEVNKKKIIISPKFAQNIIVNCNLCSDSQNSKTTKKK